ncbi:leucine-rich repeat, cysteine-containing subtype protein [Tanacetum coccineum]
MSEGKERRSKEIDLLFESNEKAVVLEVEERNLLKDRNSVSLVSRKFYGIDGITRPPSGLNQRYHHHIKITPWIQQLALEFRCLKELHIRHMVVHDEDLETLARTRGKDLRSLKIKKCKGISTDGLMHISKYRVSGAGIIATPPPLPNINLKNQTLEIRVLNQLF